MEWIIDQFLLQRCQKKHNEWVYDLEKKLVAKLLVFRERQNKVTSMLCYTHCTLDLYYWRDLYQKLT